MLGQISIFMYVRKTPREFAIFQQGYLLALNREERLKDAIQPGKGTQPKSREKPLVAITPGIQEDGIATSTLLVATVEPWGSIPLPGAHSEAACIRP